MTHTDILKEIYAEAMGRVAKNNTKVKLPKDVLTDIEHIAKNSEKRKGALSVLTTVLTHKIYNPEQDIRYHQVKLENGYSGRNIDKKEVTPFLKSVSFPAMAEAGWLTRTFENPNPYTLDYPGPITLVKQQFLNIIDSVQTKDISAKEILLYLFILLIKQRDSFNIELAKPHSLSIANIIKVLEKHFTYKYSGAGASRLPTLAIYAAYQCMMSQVTRYSGKILCPLESHNSADKQSGRIGDVDINNENGSAFEGVEIKHEIQITKQLVTDAYEKFKVHNTDRYYLLTTANMDSADWDSIEKEIQRIGQIHGCQVIVNGVYTTLKYYLRLVEDPAEFIDHYVELLKNDDSIKFQHKTVWNDIISEKI